MSSIAAANPLPSKTHSKDHSSQEVPHLELRIYTAHVGVYPHPPENITNDALAHSAMTTSPPNTSSPSDFICLLRGPLDDFLFYSRREQSKWLIDIAHDICDPAQKRGLLKVQDATGQIWNDVDPTDALIPSIYLYDVQTLISLSKISERAGKSITSATGNPSTMGHRVGQRDGGKCWVSGTTCPVTNSHVCPKRMGDHFLRIVYSNFVSTSPLPALSIYDEICGITLSLNLDAWFDTYEFGLKFMGPGTYECHSFLRTEPGCVDTIFGSGENLPADMPILHGHIARPPQPQHHQNPPPGLIRWHYLQCVIRKFAHSDYRSLPNILHYELPLRMEGDSDEEGGEYDWPSAVLDFGRAMQAEIEQDEERQRSVTEWAAGVYQY